MTLYRNKGWRIKIATRIDEGMFFEIYIKAVSPQIAMPIEHMRKADLLVLGSVTCMIKRSEFVGCASEGTEKKVIIICAMLRMTSGMRTKR